VPWCEDCARFYNPNTLDEAGDCPEGHHVAEPPSDEPEKSPGAPWHFWVLVIAISIYLGWRLIQGIVWVFEHL
jgi:hypothetical protein